MDNIAVIDWDAYAQDYDALNTLIPYKEMQRAVLDEIRTHEGGRILDAGCGTGNLIQLLSERFSENNCRDFYIFGLDQSQAMLNRASIKVPVEHVCLIQTDLNSDLPFLPETLEVIVSINTLYALDDPSKVLTRFYEVLSPGGQLILVTPKAGYENGLVLKAHCKSPKPDEHWKDAHSSSEREEILIKEAIRDPLVQEQMLRVAKWNRYIHKERKFHFYHLAALETLLTTIGFHVIARRSIYADQNIFLVARKKPKRE